MTFLSYAQNHEDVMLHRALRQVDKGFYIDVGAQHPINDSVTKAFYERGWHGINIDPVPQWIELLRSDRPHDINLQIALGAHREHKQMFALPDTGLSTDNPVFLQRHLDAGYAAVSLETEVETLDAVCERHDVATVHFLKIDVEGAETAVIRGFSFDRVRPWIVLVEAVEPVSDPDGRGGLDAVASYQEWEPLLLARNYLFAYDDGLNRFYVAAEKRELLKHFNVPANALDVFVRYQEWLKHERITQLDGEVRAMTDAVALASRRAELESLDALRRDSENRLQRIGVLEQECAALRGQMAAGQSELDQWRGNYEATEQRVMRLAEVEHRLVLSAQRDELREAEIAANHRHAQNRLQRISELEQEMAFLQGRLVVLEADQSESKNLRVLAEERAVQIANLEHDNAQWRKARDDEYQRVLRMEENLEVERTRNQTIQSELDSLRRVEESLEIERSRNLTIQSELDSLRRVEESLEIERSRNLMIQSELDTLHGKFNDLARYSSHQDEILNTILHSRSWRLTRPFRGLPDARLATTAAKPIPVKSRSATSAPGMAPGKTFLKRVLLAVMRHARNHPVLQRTAGRILAVSPKTKARLIAIMQRNSAGYSSYNNAVAANPLSDKNGYAPLPVIESSAAVNAVYERMHRALTIDHAQDTSSQERDIQG